MREHDPQPIVAALRRLADYVEQHGMEKLSEKEAFALGVLVVSDFAGRPLAPRPHPLDKCVHRDLDGTNLCDVTRRIHRDDLVHHPFVDRPLRLLRALTEEECNVRA